MHFRNSLRLKKLPIEKHQVVVLPNGLKNKSNQKKQPTRAPFLFHNSTKALIISSFLLFIVPEISLEKPMWSAFFYWEKSLNATTYLHSLSEGINIWICSDHGFLSKNSPIICSKSSAVYFTDLFGIFPMSIKGLQNKIKQQNMKYLNSWRRFEGSYKGALHRHSTGLSIGFVKDNGLSIGCVRDNGISIRFIREYPFSLTKLIEPTRYRFCIQFKGKWQDTHTRSTWWMIGMQATTLPQFAASLLGIVHWLCCSHRSSKIRVKFLKLQNQKIYI